jgi:hypothetical protein
MTKCTYNPNVEIKPHFTEMLGLKIQDYSAITQVGGQLKANLEERTAFNIGLFYNGIVNYNDPASPTNVSVSMYTEQQQIAGSAILYGTNNVGPRWQMNLTNLLIAPSGDFETILDDYAATTVTMSHVIDQNFTFGSLWLLPNIATIPPDNLLLPFITGPLNPGDIPAFAKVGEVMTANIGAWAAVVTIAYQWYSGASPIAGAINGTFTPTAHEVGTQLTVHVTATNPNGSTEATSGPTLAVHP